MTNRFSEFNLRELESLKHNVLSASTYGYDENYDKLYAELDKEYDKKEAARKAAIPKCAKCGHDLK